MHSNTFMATSFSSLTTCLMHCCGTVSPAFAVKIPTNSAPAPLQVRNENARDIIRVKITAEAASHNSHSYVLR